MQDDDNAFTRGCLIGMMISVVLWILIIGGALMLWKWMWGSVAG